MIRQKYVNAFKIFKFKISILPRVLTSSHRKNKAWITS